MRELSREEYEAGGWKARAEQLRADLARYDQKDRQKTSEINILVKENRTLTADLAREKERADLETATFQKWRDENYARDAQAGLIRTKIEAERDALAERVKDAHAATERYRRGSEGLQARVAALEGALREIAGDTNTPGRILAAKAARALADKEGGDHAR
jgi:chromosome segregation ATPase